MILILSSNLSEVTTEVVSDWILFYNREYVRINGIDLLNKKEYVISIDNNFNELKNPLSIVYENITTDNIESIKVVWYRRWYPYTFHNYVKIEEKEITKYHINEHIKQEFYSVSRYLMSIFKDKYLLSSYETAKLSKLDVLNKAINNNLLVPPTIITNNKKTLKEFRLYHKSIIVKCVSDVFPFLLEDDSFISYTSSLEEAEIDKLPEIFFPSLFQKRIEKRYEIRSFFLEGELYSMAIMSQSNKQTIEDFRNYSHEDQNRYILYKLPDDIEYNLIRLMNDLGLNTGSIDLIRSINNEYIFLEINPVGQFGMTSYPCNYFLEEKVAKTLITHDK